MRRRQAILASLAAGLAAAAGARRAAAQADLKIVANGWPDAQVHPLFAAFEAATPDIKAPYELIPPDDLLATLDKRLDARSPEPDAYTCLSEFIPAYAVHGHALALDEVLEPKRFTKAALDAARFRRKLYSAPFASACQVLFYNRALFKAAGIEPPPPDPTKRWSWEQVVDAGKHFADPANNRWGLVFEQPERPYQMLTFGESLGGAAMSAVGLQATGHLDSREFVEGFSFLQRMYTEWKISPPGLADPQATRALFGSGHAAMFIGGTGNFTGFPTDFKELDWGVAPHPSFAKGKPATPSGSWHLAVNPRTRNHDAAVRFIQYMTSDDAQMLWFKLRPHPPVLLSLWDKMPDAFNTDGWRIVRHEVENAAVPSPPSPGYREFDLLLGVTLRQMQSGGDIALLLTETARRIDHELDKYMN